MKKLVLLSFVSVLCMSVWASDPNTKGSARVQHAIAGHARTTLATTNNNMPKMNRSSFVLQKQLIGKAGNLLSVLNSGCHQLNADSAINTVLFIHRSDTFTGYAQANYSQYRFDVSKDGGNTWQNNIGPLNEAGIYGVPGLNGRYPQAMIHRDSTQSVADSAYIVYNGTWHDGSATSIWMGQFYGVGKLSGDTSTFTEDTSVVNGGRVEIAQSMTEGAWGHYFNINLDYNLVGTSGTMDSIRGLVLERGVWNSTTNQVDWTYQDLPINAAYYNNLSTISDPTIAFDPTGQYGWILCTGDLVSTDANQSTRPILMHSTDYGATWSTPQQLVLDNLPGMYHTDSILNEGKIIFGACEIAVDSAANPHIMAVVAIGDTTTFGTYYPFAHKVLYDLHYDPTATCQWQAIALANVNGAQCYYTSDHLGTDNRVQVARSKDGKKLFTYWVDTDSTLWATQFAGNLLTDSTSNINPNLYGIGIDMGSRKITNVTNFTSGDSLFGAPSAPLGITTTGVLTGALFPMISQNILPQAGGVYNIPVVLSNPDYHQTNFAQKSSANATSFYYCSNISFSQTDFVNKFDNVPPTLIVGGSDTVYIQIGQPYTPPTASATDCQYGNITPQYTSNVPVNSNHQTTSVGTFTSTWTATNPAGNSSTHTQVVIVGTVPTAIIYYVRVSGVKYLFTDTSQNETPLLSRTWQLGDASSSSSQSFPHTYSTSGTKMVVLKVVNTYGTSSDTVYIQVSSTGINDVDLAGKISVYPNPSKGLLTIDMASDITDGATVSVCNILGQTVSPSIAIKANVSSTTLDLSNLESGAYMLKIETPTGTAIKQFTINK